jgi:hypothetical protein
MPRKGRLASIVDSPIALLGRCYGEPVLPRPVALASILGAILALASPVNAIQKWDCELTAT